MHDVEQFSVDRVFCGVETSEQLLEQAGEIYEVEERSKSWIDGFFGDETISNLLT